MALLSLFGGFGTVFGTSRGSPETLQGVLGPPPEGPETPPEGTFCGTSGVTFQPFPLGFSEWQKCNPQEPTWTEVPRGLSWPSPEEVSGHPVPAQVQFWGDPSGGYRDLSRGSPETLQRVPRDPPEGPETPQKGPDFASQPFSLGKLQNAKGVPLRSRRKPVQKWSFFTEKTVQNRFRDRKMTFTGGQRSIFEPFSLYPGGPYSTGYPLQGTLGTARGCQGPLTPIEVAPAGGPTPNLSSQPRVSTLAIENPVEGNAIPYRIL